MNVYNFKTIWYWFRWHMIEQRISYNTDLPASVSETWATFKACILWILHSTKIIYLSFLNCWDVRYGFFLCIKRLCLDCILKKIRLSRGTGIYADAVTHHPSGLAL